jgi:GT2 family glycosyltransferase
MSKKTVRVTIGIATCRRPQGLSRILAAMPGLAIPPATSISLVVVDNDPTGSAASVFEETVRQIPFSAVYLQVAERGISFVRNRIIEHSIESGADVLAFIDDDEVPDATWLEQLLAVQQRYHADLVGGPVRRIFPDGTPAWYAQLGFFEPRNEPEGPTRNNIDTGNALIAVQVFTKLGLRFDSDFALSGGEDLLFSMQARRLGAQLAWAPQAQVAEHVSANRLRLRWLLARAYRGGCVTSLADYRLYPFLLVCGRNLGKATLYLGAALGKGLFCWVGSPHRRYLPPIFVARGIGLLAGLFGFTYQEYLDPDSEKPAPRTGER